jgi:hypothetical protein
MGPDYYRPKYHSDRFGSSEPLCCRECYDRWREEKMFERRMEIFYKEMVIKMTQVQMQAPIMLMGSLTDETSKGKKNMNVVKKLKALSLDKGDRLLRKYGIVSETGDLTAEGKEVLWNILLQEKKTEIVSKVEELEAAEKKKK